jgi:hypothetical protein
MTAIGAMYVRDPHRMAPDSRPVDTYPEGVLCDISKMEENAMLTFVYTLREGVLIRHLFTCNRSSVQKYANELFGAIQMQVPLIWMGATTGLATGEWDILLVLLLEKLDWMPVGPYFSYLVGPGHGDDASAVPWDKVPECIQTIREKIQDFTAEGGLEGYKVSQMTVLAWQATGKRKVCIFSSILLGVIEC